jgi:hypothetical protein
MAATTPNQGLLAILNILTGGSPIFTCHLYTNNVSWAQGIVLANVVEANFSGYAAVAMSGFATPTISGSGAGQSLASLIQFIVASGGVSNLVYGYYITFDPGTGPLLVFGEAFPTAPIPMANIGDEIDLSLTLQDFPS